MSALESSVDVWRGCLGLPDWMPSWLVVSVCIFCIYFFVILPSGAAMSYVDRKLSADFQARVGPNRAGPAGIFQPFADFLKLLQKDFRRDHDVRESLWLSISAMALYSAVAIVPLGSSFVFVNTDMSAFLPLWSAITVSFATLLLGFEQRSVNGWFGGVRSAAQAIAGVFPALICLLCAGVHSGGFHWTDFSSSQGSFPNRWIALSSPFEFMAFVVFVAAGLVLLDLPPLNGGSSLADLKGGVSSELSGRRLSLFQVSRFYAFFLWAQVTVVLFLGAWNLPFHLGQRLAESGDHWSVIFLELLCLVAKTFSLMIVLLWIARINPRVRVDQTTDLAWKILSPLALASLIGTGLWESWRIFL